MTSLIERNSAAAKPGSDTQLIANIDASLDAVEEIFSALLDISRLDTGAMRSELTGFRVDDLFRQIDVDFAPMARAKNLGLTFVPSSLTVHTDRRLLRRILQNLVSNAVKYTPAGRVVVG